MGISHRFNRAVWLSTYLLLVVMMVGTLPTPLYPLYARQLDLSPFWVTLVFASYALAILFKLLIFGRLSDLLGRRVVLGLGIGLTLASLLSFLLWPTLVGLFVGRLLSGMAVGLMVGASTAYLAELLGNRSLAALIASLSNMGGLGFGALLSGWVAEQAAQPLHASYVVLLLMLLPAVLLPWLPETVIHGGSRPPLRLQRLRIPSEMRQAFMAVAMSVLCGFSFLGLFAALAGRFLAVGLHQSGILLSGSIVFLAFCSAAIGQLLVLRMAPRRVVPVGVLLLPVALASVWLAFEFTSLTLFLGGAVLGGMGAGMVLRGGLGLVTMLSPADRMAEVSSAFFVAAYLGLIVPVVGVGLLLSVWEMSSTIGLFGGLVTLMAIFSSRAVLALGSAPEPDLAIAVESE
ncbi:MFS transporter [Pseudomonas sp. PB103]|jgi:predicted MFS family arabinose efflux permease|uniref:MFS transporter n=1 Tax=Pseudomonas sp. PB103 TaxID=2494698 RepID=UPI00131BA819|nr:MFS transporter [Pseudomonas sp. PB103]KAE9644233.1 MFS transporter [Pseudomonas sp. PB103]